MVTRPVNCSEAFALSESNVNHPASSSPFLLPSLTSTQSHAQPTVSSGDTFNSSHHQRQSTSFTCSVERAAAASQTTTAADITSTSVASDGDREEGEKEEQTLLLTHHHEFDQREGRRDNVQDEDDTLCVRKSHRKAEKSDVKGRSSECTSLLTHRQSHCESSEQLHHLSTPLSSLELSTQGIFSTSNASSSSSRTHTDIHLHASLCVSPTALCNENTDDTQFVSSSSSSSSSPSSTCATLSTTSQLVSQTSVCRTFAYIFSLLAVVLVISYSCLGSYVNVSDRKVSSRSSIESNMRQELISNASNINDNLTVYNSKYHRNSLLNNENNNNNNDNDLSNKSNNTFENNESNKILLNTPDALIMISNMTSSFNSQQEQHTIDISSPSVSTLFSRTHSSVESTQHVTTAPGHTAISHHRGHRRRRPHRNEDKGHTNHHHQEQYHHHHRRHKRIRCKNGMKDNSPHSPRHQRHRHHPHCDTSTSDLPSDVNTSATDNIQSSVLPHNLINNDSVVDDRREVIAVENLVMTSLPNITDEDDLVVTAATAHDIPSQGIPLNNRSLASSTLSYPITALSVNEVNTVTLATVKDDTVTTTSSREHFISPPSSSSASSSPSSSPSFHSSQDKSNNYLPVISSIEKARGVPPVPFFFLNPCSGYAVSLNDKNRITAIHEVPAETHQLISNLTRARGRWTRHLARNEKYSLLWYFQKNNAPNLVKRKTSHHFSFPWTAVDISIQSRKRVSRSAHNPSQVSPERSTATSNFASAVWILQSYTYWVKGSVKFAVTIQSKSGAFICFGKRGKLVTKSSGNSAYCMFNDRKIGGFYTYSSILKPEWTIGFDCHGKPIHHHQDQVTRKRMNDKTSSKHKTSNSCSGRNDDEDDEDDDQFKNQGKCFQFLRVNVPPSLLTS